MDRLSLTEHVSESLSELLNGSLLSYWSYQSILVVFDEVNTFILWEFYGHLRDIGMFENCMTEWIAKRDALALRQFQAPSVDFRLLKKFSLFMSLKVLSKILTPWTINSINCNFFNIIFYLLYNSIDIFRIYFGQMPYNLYLNNY